MKDRDVADESMLAARSTPENCQKLQGSQEGLRLLDPANFDSYRDWVRLCVYEGLCKPIGDDCWERKSRYARHRRASSIGKVRATHASQPIDEPRQRRAYRACRFYFFTGGGYFLNNLAMALFRFLLTLAGAKTERSSLRIIRSRLRSGANLPSC